MCVYIGCFWCRFRCSDRCVVQLVQMFLKFQYWWMCRVQLLLNLFLCRLFLIIRMWFLVIRWLNLVRLLENVLYLIWFLLFLSCMNIWFLFLCWMLIIRLVRIIGVFWCQVCFLLFLFGCVGGMSFFSMFRLVLISFLMLLVCGLNGWLLRQKFSVLCLFLSSWFSVYFLVLGRFSCCVVLIGLGVLNSEFWLEVFLCDIWLVVLSIFGNCSMSEVWFLLSLLSVLQLIIVLRVCWLSLFDLMCMQKFSREV